LIYLWNPTAADADAARTAAERAIALAPKRPEGYYALGAYYSNVQRDEAQAIEQYTRAQQLAPQDADVLAEVAGSELDLGRGQAALTHARQAEALDPRSVPVAALVMQVLTDLHRYPEALRAAERALALAPDNLMVIHLAVRVHLGRGDLISARRVLRDVPRTVDPTALVAYIATNQDLFWVLDDAQQRLLLRLSPEPFGGNRADWGMALAQTHAFRGDTGLARAYADSARIAYQAQVRDVPDNPTPHVLLGVMLGYLGRSSEAIREGERGVTLATRLRPAAYDRHQLLRIYLMAGRTEKALDQLEILLKMVYLLSPDWVRIDPNFAPLRGNPRFERMLARSTA
jgi:tetratricopeptide (TPR) repeat protein